MKPLSFWRSSDYDQIQAINAAAGDIGSLQASTSVLHREVVTLRRVVASQQAEIGQLKSALLAGQV